MAVLEECSFCENSPDDINTSVWQDNGGNVFETICAACPGDVDGDGYIDVNDVLGLINVWDTSDSDADFDGDGLVDADDVLILLSHYGEICP